MRPHGIGETEARQVNVVLGSHTSREAAVSDVVHYADNLVTRLVTHQLANRVRTSEVAADELLIHDDFRIRGATRLGLGHRPSLRAGAAAPRVPRAAVAGWGRSGEAQPEGEPR